MWDLGKDLVKKGIASTLEQGLQQEVANGVVDGLAASLANGDAKAMEIMAAVKEGLQANVSEESIVKTVTEKFNIAPEQVQQYIALAHKMM